MERRSGTVILVGTHSAYTEDKGDAQIWGINLAFRHQPNVDRLYLMDPLDEYRGAWGDEFDANVQAINDLNIPVVMQFHYPCLTNSRRFGYKKSFDSHSISFFGVSAANAIADVIAENFERLVLHKMYVKGESDEYLFHRPIVGFWIGQAIAHGIGVEVDEDCMMNQEVLHHLGREQKRRREREVAGLSVAPPTPVPLVEMLQDELKRRHRRGEIGEAQCAT